MHRKRQSQNGSVHITRPDTTLLNTKGRAKSREARRAEVRHPSSIRLGTREPSRAERHASMSRSVRPAPNTTASRSVRPAPNTTVGRSVTPAPNTTGSRSVTPAANATTRPWTHAKRCDRAAHAPLACRSPGPAAFRWPIRFDLAGRPAELASRYHSCVLHTKGVRPDDLSRCPS